MSVNCCITIYLLKNFIMNDNIGEYNQHYFFCHCTAVYSIPGNFGYRFNLAIWQNIARPPNLKFANINFLSSKKSTPRTHYNDYTAEISKKSEQAAEIVLGTWPMMVPSRITATAYTSWALPSSLLQSGVRRSWGSICCRKHDGHGHSSQLQTPPSRSRT